MMSADRMTKLKNSFDKALRSYFAALQSGVDTAAQLAKILRQLKEYKQLDLANIISSGVVNAETTLGELILALAKIEKSELDFRNGNYSNDYIAAVLNMIDTQIRIADLYSKFINVSGENHWQYHAASTALLLIKSKGPEPTIFLQDPLKKAEYLLALQAIIKCHDMQSIEYPMSDTNAYTASMILAGFHLDNNLDFSQAAPHYHYAKRLCNQRIINPISQTFIDVFVRHYPEGYQENDISLSNALSNKLEFILALRAAIAVDSMHARKCLETFVKQDSLLSLVANEVLNDKFYDANYDDLSLTSALAFYYGLSTEVNLVQAARNFESLTATTSVRNQKFYYNLMGIMAEVKLITEESQYDLIEHALSSFQIMMAYYTFEYELEYHLQVFDSLFDLLRLKSSPENDLAIFMLLIEYSLLLLDSSKNRFSTKLSLIQIEDLFNILFTELHNTSILDSAANYQLVINAMARLLTASKLSAPMFNYMLRKYYDISVRAISLNDADLNHNLQHILVMLADANRSLLNINSIDLALLSLNKLLRLQNKNNVELITLVTDFNLLAASMKITSKAQLVYLNQALRFAVLPENSAAISRVYAKLAAMQNPSENTTALMSFAGQALKAAQTVAPFDLATIAQQGYFPAWVKLAYINIAAANTRRALYLSARVFCELTIHADKLKQDYFGLNDDSITTCKADMFQYICSLRDNTDFVELANWYKRIICLVTNLNVTRPASIKQLDIDALMYINSSRLFDISRLVRHGMIKANNKNDNYYYSKSDSFVALDLLWGNRIILSQSSTQIEMTLFSKPRTNVADVDAQEQKCSPKA